MQFSVDRGALLSAMAHVHRVVERRNTIPILSNVLIRADAGEIRLRATDLDLEATERVAATVSAPGSLTVPASTLYDIVRKLPSRGTLECDAKADGSALVIVAGRSRFVLQALPETDFPEIDTGTLPHRFSITAGELRRLIDRTQFAISTDETRYYLNGIFLHVLGRGDGRQLRAVATDGHRLAYAEADAPKGSEEMPGIIIPRKAIGEIHKLADDPEAAMTFELSDSKIRLTVGDLVLTSKLIDGTFPVYERVIPTGNDKRMLIDRDQLAQAVDRVATVSTGKGRGIKFTLSRDRLVLNTGNSEGGSGIEELATEYAGPNIEIGFNARYVLDALASVEPGPVLLRIGTPADPARFEPPASSAIDERALIILMPMRVT